MSLFEFAASDPDPQNLAGKAALIGSVLQSRGPATVGVVPGAGLIWDDGRLRPMVVVAKERVAEIEHGIYPLPRIETAWTLVRDAFEPEAPEWLRDVAAFVLPSPEPYLGPGDTIVSPGIGTVGCKVSWNGGVGFLTAGHVAPNRGQTVHNGLTSLGTVREVSNPAGSGTAAKADVAVIELSGATAFNASHRGAAAARPMSTINVLNAASGTGNIMAFCTFCHWPKVNGTYGDTYLTTWDISTGGDSGAAVVDANNNVIGLVVGGTRGITTFIQDVRYQIAQLAPQSSRFGGLSL